MSGNKDRGRIVIAGGSGFLGASLGMYLANAPLLMRTDPELGLYGRYVISRRLQEEGFEFQFPKLEQALHDLLHERASN